MFCCYSLNMLYSVCINTLDFIEFLWSREYCRFPLKGSFPFVPNLLQQLLLIQNLLNFLFVGCQMFVCSVLLCSVGFHPILIIRPNVLRQILTRGPQTNDTGGVGVTQPPPGKRKKG